MKAYITRFCLISILLLNACDPSNPNNPNEEEVITTLQIIADDGVNSWTFSFSDPDGPGGSLPTVDTIWLSPSNNYTVNLHVLDESKTPTDTITHEIVAESDDHQFFFQSSGANLGVTYNDTDINGYPIGLSSTWTTGLTSSGNITITLRHLPDKSGLNVANGDISNAGGETDIEVGFPVVIQ